MHAFVLFLALACSGADPVDTSTSEPGDSAADTVDTSSDTGGGVVESDEANRGGTCTFNRDCPADQRCGCTEAEGCACEDGVRGTGVNGVDACTDGNDCASSLCVEGLDAYYCSDACSTNEDCGPALPVCADIAFLGRVCIREAR
jgi:hypothetical protein